ncbi:unnamed protein product [Calicophoron daubneyi]|uniref:Uncharacterized protein n=1 Tax=Calicophoron daubneyi TaxID=300641 RepID=A0AAV2TBI6_CALDB
MRPRLGMLRVSRDFRFVHPLSVILFVTLLVYGLIWIVHLDIHTKNYLAARVRNDEELRVARAYTKISEWRQKARNGVFSYMSDDDETTKLEYEELDPAPGLTFAILAPNRRTHEIDAYEPSYLTESLVNLIDSIYHDLSVYGKRFSFVNITLCPTTDDLAHFSELVEVSNLLPKTAIKTRPRAFDNFSLSCRTILDAASCLSQSSSGILSEYNYVILLEDDLMANEYLLNRLWGIVLQLRHHRHPNLTVPNLRGASENNNAVHLYTPHSSLNYSIRDSSSFAELILISIALMIILFILYLKQWCRSFDFSYNALFVLCTFIICVFIVGLIGRANLLYGWHKLLRDQALLPNNPSSDQPVAALLLSSKIAHGLGSFIQTFNCLQFSPLGKPLPKSRIIYDFLFMHQCPVWFAFPNLFEHRGLYSVYKHGIWDPSVLE